MSLSDRLKIFVKAQTSSLIGGTFDYLVMIGLTEFFGIHYTVSIVISGIAGAVVNFSINKTWAFYRRENTYRYSHVQQLARFAVVVCNSIMLKTAGTYFFTETVHIDYKISRLMVELLVSILFNYMLQRHWVFRNRKNPRKINPECP
ncbi:MAG: GtrA family protein [Bacteroidales bacterium]|jgi:putative flippase GtrA|nr:GtrA family protein [Bacteroidales bacterium]